MQVTSEDFQQFAELRQRAHRLSVALEFYHSTTGSIGKAQLQRAVCKILGRPLPDRVVRALPPHHNSACILQTLNTA